MARISDISVKQVPEHYSVTIRKTIDFIHEYAVSAQYALDTVKTYLDGLEVVPLSGPITCFFNRDLEMLDVEIGWQIAEPVESTREIFCNKVLAHKVITTYDLGPYEEQDATLEDLLDWAREHDCDPEAPVLYCYLNDTERPPAQFLTQMSLRIK